MTTKRGWEHCAYARDDEGLPKRWGDWCEKCRGAMWAWEYTPNGAKGRGALFDPNRDSETWPTPRL